jgi:hypothetical protein
VGLLIWLATLALVIAVIVTPIFLYERKTRRRYANERTMETDDSVS